MPDIDPDATIIARHRQPVAQAAPVARGPNKLLIATGAVVAIAVIGGGIGLYWASTPPAKPAITGLTRPAPPLAAQPPAASAPNAATPAVSTPAVSTPAPGGTAATLPRRTEAEILAEAVTTPTAVWFAPNPDILVIDFPDLTIQGESFNRIAAFVEKRGLSHDRVLDDRDLAAAIRADNATVATYYYGHDYRAADIQRFYAAVDAQRLQLTAPELTLRKLLTQTGLLVPGANKAVIAIPRQGSDPFVDASGRQSLLRHELSHGEYFTDPAYAAYVQHFWTATMTPADRANFRSFLTRQGYDPTDRDLIINEMQAHLMNTTDRRYFNAAACGMPVARLQALRQAFLAGMPAGWLRDAMTQMTPHLPT